MEQNWFNDFQRMVRADNIEGIIDRSALRRPPAERSRQERDVLAMLDALYASDPSSYPAILRLMESFGAVTPDQLRLIVHVLRNGTFTEYAKDEGVTKAAVGQRWKTVAKRAPIVEGIR